MMNNGYRIPGRPVGQPNQSSFMNMESREVPGMAPEDPEIN